MIQSDKNIKIFNLINLIHDLSEEDGDKLAIQLTFLSRRKKIFWIFKSEKVQKEKFTKFVNNIVLENNFLNIILLKKLDKNKTNYIKDVSKNYGKKIIEVSFNKKSKNKKDESIFYCKVNKDFSNLKKEIFNLINQI